MSLQTRLKRFSRDESGAVTIELLFSIPLLMFVLMGCLVFYEGYRARANAVKATYTIADVLSREEEKNPITPRMMSSLYTLYASMMSQEEALELRVSVISYDEKTKTYKVEWSRARNAEPRLTTASLQPRVNDFIPKMSNGEIGIIVETASRYTPIFYAPLFSVVVRPAILRNTMVIRPRSASELCWSDKDTGPWEARDKIC